MRFLHGLIGVLRRLLAFGRRRHIERDIDDELAFHLEMRRKANEQDGLDPANAGRSARRQFGNVAALREETRDMWAFPSFDSLVQDVRFAFRTLIKAPGFTVIAVLVLAIGIGANTAIFSLVDAMLVRGLPYTNPDGLVLLIGNVQRQEVERRGGSYPDYEDWRDQAVSFEGMAAYSGLATTVTSGEGDPARLVGESVSAPYFSLLDVAPIHGRTFRPDEDEIPGASPVVILSHATWLEEFGGDAGVIGRSVRLDGDPAEIIGVMPPGFAGVTDQARLWVPFVNSYSGQTLDERGQRWLNALARLQPDVPLEQAQTEMNTIAARLEAAYPESNEARGVEISPLSVEVLGDLRPAVLALMGAVSFVLLIACANVANLLIGRSEARQREIAVRTALGAGRARLLRQLVTESCVLSGLGAIAGVVLAMVSVQTLVAQSPVTFPSYVEPTLNMGVLLFTIGVALACGLLLGLAPALHTRIARLGAALKDTARGSTTSSQRVRATLVVVEVALAVVLVAGSGLMIRTVSNLTAVEPGFETEQLLTFSMSIPEQVLTADEVPVDAPSGPPRLAVPPRDLLARLQAVPGIVDAALSSDRPLQGGGSAVFYAAEGDETTDAESRPRAYFHFVTPTFFRTMGLPIVRGRTFSPEEMAGPATTMVVSESVVNRFWPGEDPLGRRISIGSREFSVVGVVAESLYRSMPENPTADPDLFLPYSDRGSQGVVLRTGVPPESLIDQVRQAVREADPGIVVFQINTIGELVDAQTAQSRFTAWLMSVFAGAALLLAIVGIYGVMAYLVTQRTREFGIRLALGAGRGEIVRLILGRAAILIGIGLALGVATAVATTSWLNSIGWLETMIFNVSLIDLSSAVAVSMLGLVALAACVVPALRATRVDPVIALRAD